MTRMVAVVLSGCGFRDGSEIIESVSVLVHLARHGLAVKCFAPEGPQAEVYNHATGKPMPAGQTRNMLVEAARIARGDIAPVSKLSVVVGAATFDAVVFPGGFGAAKSLCGFARSGAASGAECEVLPDVERVVKEFHAAGKVIGACCIAPVLVARVLGTRAGGPGCAVTVGTDEGVAAAIGTMGARHVAKGVTEAFVDAKARVVTTPAYMFDSDPHSVFTGIGAMIDGIVGLMG